MAPLLFEYSASDLAGLIASREVSSREVVDAHLDRIAAVNPALNAITVEMAESARAAADSADRIDRAESRGPLHGVPFTIKEYIDQVGYPTTQGVAAFADAMPTSNAVTVQRLLDAGAIPIGRTNMPELGLRVSTDNSFRGLTRNPWSFDHTAGGSSGGEGSAIASGMSPFGLGNDIGGSLRNPALCCGITALKPGFGRVPRVSSAPGEMEVSAQLMSVEGPMARSVADLRLMFEIIAGRTPRDPRVCDIAFDGPVVERRCGVVRSLPGASISPGVSLAVDHAASAMAAAGWELVEVDPPELEATHAVWLRMLAFDFEPSLPLLAGLMGSDELAVLAAVVDRGRSLPGTPQQLFAERMRLQKLWSHMFCSTSVVIGPGWNNPPFRHGADVIPGRQVRILDEHLSFIVPANALGLPVVALSTGVADGLPVGVQVYADGGREDLCLAAASIVEAAGPPLRPKTPEWI